MKRVIEGKEDDCRGKCLSVGRDGVQSPWGGDFSWREAFPPPLRREERRGGALKIFDLLSPVSTHWVSLHHFRSRHQHIQHNFRAVAEGSSSGLMQLVSLTSLQIVS